VLRRRNGSGTDSSTGKVTKLQVENSESPDAVGNSWGKGGGGFAQDRPAQSRHGCLSNEVMSTEGNGQNTGKPGLLVIKKRKGPGT